MIINNVIWTLGHKFSAIINCHHGQVPYSNHPRSASFLIQFWNILYQSKLKSLEKFVLSSKQKYIFHIIIYCISRLERAVQRDLYEFNVI